MDGDSKMSHDLFSATADQPLPTPTTWKELAHENWKRDSRGCPAASPHITTPVCRITNTLCTFEDCFHNHWKGK